MMWAWLALVATIIFGAGKILDKVVVTGYYRGVAPILMLIGLMDLLFAGVFYAAGGGVLRFGDAQAVAFLGGIVFIWALYFYFRGLRREELGRFVPLLHTKPLFVALLALVFVGEVLTLQKYAGILVVVAGAAAISFKKVKGRQKMSRALAFVLASVVLLSIQLVMVKWVLGHIGYWEMLLHTFLGTFASSLALFGGRGNRERFVGFIRDRGGGLLALNNVAAAVALVINAVAISLGPVALVATINAVQPLFVLLLAVGFSLWKPYVLEEDIGGPVMVQKLLGTLLILVGIVLIS